MARARASCHRPRDWIQIARDNIAFGQGLSVNAVQMASAISAIANGGVYVEPSLVEGYVDSDGDVTPADPAPSSTAWSARAPQPRSPG